MTTPNTNNDAGYFELVVPKELGYLYFKRDASSDALNGAWLRSEDREEWSDVFTEDVRLLEFAENCIVSEEHAISGEAEAQAAEARETDRANRLSFTVRQQQDMLIATNKRLADTQTELGVEQQRRRDAEDNVTRARAMTQEAMDRLAVLETSNAEYKGANADLIAENARLSLELEALKSQTPPASGEGPTLAELQQANENLRRVGRMVARASNAMQDSESQQ